MNSRQSDQDLRSRIILSESPDWDAGGHLGVGQRLMLLLVSSSN